jgi:prevent-host-death family protein
VNPNRIGAIAETAVAAEATRLGFDVLRPITDGGRYDLAFETGHSLIRVQCKSAQRHGEVVVVRAHASRRTATGYLRTTYSRDEVDVIAAYCPDLNRCFAVPITAFAVGGTLHLRLSPARNGQRAGLHFADDYPLGAIAQLAERPAGSRKGVGSSPTSSTPSPTAPAPAPTIVGAHEFRNRFGWYMERAAAGEDILVTRRGKPHLRLSAVAPALDLAA